MIYSNKLNLDEFFTSVKNQKYSIIKMSEDFPNYYKGSDIDIFCSNKKEFGKSILAVGNKYLSQGVYVEVTNNEEESHTYIDFYFNDELDFRFDLYSAMPQFNTIKIKDYFLYSILDRRKSIDREFNGEKYPIFVPEETDELILRYIEYMEWYEKRQDKIKHLDYILDKISDEKIKKEFLDRLHLYAEFPSAKAKNSIRRLHMINRYFSLPLYYMKKIKSKGIAGTLKGLKNKVLNKL